VPTSLVLGTIPSLVTFTFVVILDALTPSFTKYALTACPRFLASIWTASSLAPGNLPAAPVTKKVASAPAFATAFLIFTFCGVVKAEEPAGNENELVTVSFSLAVAAELTLRPESAITKLVIRIVTSVEILRMFLQLLGKWVKKLNHTY
jgi:hypothetical protein